MYNILIVDDEAIIRTSISLLVKWEEEGFRIIGDVANGKQALQFMETQEVHIVITDIKMPVMDGVELLKELKARGSKVGIVVLSGYNDFPLVKETFKLGAKDYLLKSDINEESLKESVKHVAATLEEIINKEEISFNYDKKISKEEDLKQLVLEGKASYIQDWLKGAYRLACFEIDDFQSEAIRFGKNLSEELVVPMINFASQIPRVHNKCLFVSLSPSRYILLCPVQGEDQSLSICKQVVSVWKNYMNINVSVGLSRVLEGEAAFHKGFEETLANISMKFIFGRGKIHTYEDYDLFNPYAAMACTNQYDKLMKAISSGFHTKIEAEQQKLLAKLYDLSLEEAVLEGLYLIYHMALMLKENNDEIWIVFNTDTNFYEKLKRLDSIKQIEIWLINFIRWVLDYMEHHYARKQEDLIERAKRFIYDNFSNPSLSVAAVASYIGFNEKYFCTWFTKAVGVSFSNYLTELRMTKAKALMDQTHMKIYEVSEHVGYKSVEHFNRVFKKTIGVSPTQYRKS